MNNLNLAPIALFAFNRPDHLARTLSALAKNKFASDSQLFIFCDGSRAERDLHGVLEVRKVAKSAQGFLAVTVIEAPQNKGLAESIISGVTELSSKFGKVIVVEDDLVTSPFFLQYMNEGLEKYKDEEKVISLHGYIYPVEKKMESPFFLRGADCWGWATWERGWSLFNPDAKFLLSELKSKQLTRRFDFNGSYPYTKMLEEYIKGSNNSWAIRWYASAFLANKLTLYPNISLVQNIGLDSSGTHCSTDISYAGTLATESITLPSNLFQESEEGLNEIAKFFKKRNSLKSKFARFVQAIRHR